MFHRATLPTVTFVLLATLTVAGQEKAKTEATTDKIDKKVVEIVKQTGNLYKSAKHLHSEATFASKIEDGDEKKDVTVTAVFDVEKPNRLSMKTKSDGDATKGPDVIADGKTLFIYRKTLKQYTEQESPKSMGDIGIVLLRIGKVNAGMLFGNILAEDPAELLMQGVNSCSYVGKDKIDGTPVHRMKFSQDDFDWELWVAAEGKPFVLRMVSTGEGPNGKVTTTETYRNWKLDAAPAKESFTFAAPKDATKVKEFSR